MGSRAAGLLGAVTVLTAQDVRLAADAGEPYTVTPAFTETVAASRALELPVLVGAQRVPVGGIDTARACECLTARAAETC
ncbi:hypothetical protein [Streptomyces luteogriseus]|uniref:hypothetical protein n=1 Tax=Streptomyces luteogriseus TaxID=68233 RepID=UPI002E3640CA|nr:hypothetical protein [Streptomyces luteogriseus]WTJ25620.1 hypothetical protein OID52_00330 [Streptomyces luteogriseus]